MGESRTAGAVHTRLCGQGGVWELLFFFYFRDEWSLGRVLCGENIDLDSKGDGSQQRLLKDTGQGLT